jgi:hypothetical protein
MAWAGHSHVVRSGKARVTMEGAVAVARGLGLNYFGFGSPWDEEDRRACAEIEASPESVRRYFEGGWAGKDLLRAHRFEEWRRRFSDDGFLFGVDNESPKGRYGHLWWIGWHPDAPFFHDYDQPNEWWMHGGRQGPPPPYARREMAEILDLQRARGALAVMAHPTSWWRDAKGGFVTNVAAELPLLLAAGRAPDAMVVMGYDADHAAYQALWHHLMAEGHYLPGVAELDWSLDDPSSLAHVPLVNLVRLGEGEAWSEKALQAKVRGGAVAMTSGPRVWASLGGKDPGAEVPAAEAGEVALWLGGGAPVRRVELLRDGLVARAVEHDGSPGAFALPLGEARDGAWVVKAFGADRARQVAIANPFFVGARKRPSPRAPVALPRPYPAAWRELTDYLALGHFLRDFAGLRPGEVPPAAFRLDDFRRAVTEGIG